MVNDFELKDTNSPIVAAIEKSAKNNIKHTLDAVADFMKRHEFLRLPTEANMH